jgi:hypothetical protein
MFRRTYPIFLAVWPRGRPWQTEQAIREAIAFHLEGLREDGSPIPPASSQVEYVEVAASRAATRWLRSDRLRALRVL